MPASAVQPLDQWASDAPLLPPQGHGQQHGQQLPLFPQVGPGASASSSTILSLDTQDASAAGHWGDSSANGNGPMRGFGRVLSSLSGFLTHRSSAIGRAAAVPASALLRNHRTGSSSSSTSVGGGASAAPNHLDVGGASNAPGIGVSSEVSEARLQDLVQSGRSRRDALRQVTRENMDAEVHEGLAETLAVGAYPGMVGIRFCLGILCMCFLAVTLLICVCCCLMNLAGVCLTFWLSRCDHQSALRHWLILLQALVLTEGCFVGMINGCLRGCLLEHMVTLDARVRPGFTRAVLDLSLVVLSSAWKVAWCVHAQSLVSKAPAEKGCAETLPCFIDWYSRVLLLQVIMVQPTARLVMSLLLWAATSGVLATTRGAKPGTLEELEIVEYDPALFADPDDTTDSRPQRDCPICLEDYVRENQILRTPCRHFMHRECLGRWLQASHFCPICRTDLELDPSAQP